MRSSRRASGVTEIPNCRLRTLSLRLAAAHLDIQVAPYVNLDELGQPYLLGHACEHLEKPVIDGSREVDDPPTVQRLGLAATDRVLNVEDRLAGAGPHLVVIRVSDRRRTDKGGPLVLMVQIHPLQDGAVLVRPQPQALL